MKTTLRGRIGLLAMVLFVGLGSATVGSAQQPTGGRAWTNIVVPQLRCWASHGPMHLAIQGVKARIEIIDQVATTTVEVEIRNNHSIAVWGTVCFPVPVAVQLKGCRVGGKGIPAPMPLHAIKLDGSALHELALEMRDPALLEFMGHALIRTSPMQIGNGGTRTLTVVYEQILPADGNRVDFVLPRSAGLQQGAPWDIAVTISDTRSIGMVYSPSHPLHLSRQGPGKVSARVPQKSGSEPGAFRLSYLLGGDSLTSSFITFPNAGTDRGWFLLLAGMPLKAPEDAETMKREVTLVLDRSGSMNGEKFEQAREAAKQIIAGLNAGDAFNIIVYNATIQTFAPGAVVKSSSTEKKARSFLDALRPEGGTNLHEALKTALAPSPAEGMLPLVLFLTDGLPTVGNTSEIAIRELAIKGNPHQRRVFTFGVGHDVNSPLLERISKATKARPTLVLPGEDVEVKVSQVFKRLQGPVLVDPVLAVFDAAGAPADSRIMDLTPGTLTDLFEGDQIVLMGRYTGTEPLTLRLSGNYHGQPRSFDLKLRLDQGSQDHAYVARLWAARRIGELIDQIRQLGADRATPIMANAANKTIDHRIDELVKSIVALSTRYGIITEYTSFIAEASTDLSDVKRNYRDANVNFVRRAMSCRTGQASSNQTLNGQAQQRAESANFRNRYWDASMKEVVIMTVQQVRDLAFFKRKHAWVDSRIVNDGDDLSGATIVVFGSTAWNSVATMLEKKGLSACLSLPGDILVVLEGKRVLIKRP